MLLTCRPIAEYLWLHSNYKCCLKSMEFVMVSGTTRLTTVTASLYYHVSSQNTWSLYFLTSWYMYQTYNMPVQQNWLRHYTDMWILIFTGICNLNCLWKLARSFWEELPQKQKLLTIWTHLISERTISDCYECPLLWSSFLTAWQPPQVPQILVCIVWLNDLPLCVELLSSPLLSSPLQNRKWALLPVCSAGR